MKNPEFLYDFCSFIGNLDNSLHWRFFLDNSAYLTSDLRNCFVDDKQRTLYFYLEAEYGKTP